MYKYGEDPKRTIYLLEQTLLQKEHLIDKLKGKLTTQEQMIAMLLDKLSEVA